MEDEKTTESTSSTMKRSFESESEREFNENKRQKLLEMKKRHEEENREMRRLKNDLKKKQIEKTKKELAGNPLSVDQLKIYDRAVKKVERRTRHTSPPRKTAKLGSPSKESQSNESTLKAEEKTE